ncbi:Potassium/proton antiporter OS=Streptomyces tendae OX=1932 GN=GUR47_27380 PE=4 SV=1 [Streptomyces tendae]
MFVLLGLLVTPHELGDDILPALVIGLVLTMVARPLSVVLCLAPFRVPWQEQALMSWAGLRGAVPIILATIPMVEGVDRQSPHLQHRLRAGRRLHPGPGSDAAVAGPQAAPGHRGRRPADLRHRVGHPWSGCAGTCCR